jgi:hypothetical protein
MQLEERSKKDIRHTWDHEFGVFDFWKNTTPKRTPASKKIKTPASKKIKTPKKIQAPAKSTKNTSTGTSTEPHDGTRLHDAVMKTSTRYTDYVQRRLTKGTKRKWT